MSRHLIGSRVTFPDGWEIDSKGYPVRPIFRAGVVEAQSERLARVRTEQTDRTYLVPVQSCTEIRGGIPQS